MFASRYDEKSKSDSESDDEKDSTIFDDSTSRKREISTAEESDDGNSSKNDKRFKGSKTIMHSRPHISHPSRKRSISPDTRKVIKKLKRKHKEDSLKRKLRKNLEKRKRNKRKRLRRKVVAPKYIEPSNTDDEVDNVSDMDVPEVNEDVQPSENENVDGDGDEVEENVDENADENRVSAEETDSGDSSSGEENDEEDDADSSTHVNCVTVEDFEKVRKAIKNYSADTVINDHNGLHVIQTLFKGILDGWIPICTSQKQMFSKKSVALIRKAKKSKIIDLHSLILDNREELENIFNFIDKSIKLVVESYNQFGITDKHGEPK